MQTSKAGDPFYALMRLNPETELPENFAGIVKTRGELYRLWRSLNAAGMVDGTTYPVKVQPLNLIETVRKTREPKPYKE